MTSILEVEQLDTLSSNASSTLTIGGTNTTTINLGASGKSIVIPSGATLTNNGTVTGIGGTNTPAFEAHLSGSDQNLLVNVDTKIQFNTEVFDTDSCYDNTTNYRFTPTVAGKYFVYTTFRVTNTQSSLQYLIGRLKKNGSVYKTLIQDDRNNYGYQASLTINAIVDMNGTTDYLEGFAQVGVQGGTISMKSTDKCNSFGAYKLIGA
jgi:hypothetical protein